LTSFVSSEYKEKKLAYPIPGIDPGASAMLNISFSDISPKDHF
jgi:hypothetical protein